MADKTVDAPLSPPRPRRRWLKVLFAIVVVFVLLLVVSYFVVSSSAFLKSAVLPRVGKSLNADITVSDAQLHPFREVVFHNLKVQPHGVEPLLTAPEVRARYHLLDILGGNIHVDEVVLTSPTIDYVQHADDTTNLDPLKKAQEQKPKKEGGEPAKSSKATQIDLKKLSITDATIRSTKISKSGTKDVTELSHVNLSLDDLKNGQTGKLLLNADINMQNNPQAPGTNGTLQAKLSGNFVFSLTSDLKPASVTGNTRLEVSQASGAFAELVSLGSDLDCEVTPTEIKQLALRFRKGTTRLAELRITGPFDAQKSEGRLKVEVASVDRQVLNLVGVKSGLDFGSTTINSTNEILLSKNGKAITASGQVAVNRFQVTRTNQTTPTLDFLTKYDLSVDAAAETAVVRDFTLSGTQSSRPLLHGELTSPMSISWGNVSNAVGDSAFNLTVSNLNLVDWKPFLQDAASAGVVDLGLKVLSQQAGKLITFDLSSRVDNLAAGSGSNQISQASVIVQAHGQASDLKQFNLSDYKLQLARQNQPLLDLSGSGTYDKATEAADFQVLLRATLARLVEIMPRTDMAISSGTAELKGRVTQKQNVQTVTGNLTLADLTGKIGKNDFRNFGTKVELELNKSPQSLQIRKATGSLAEANNPGGSFDLSGTYETNGNSQITVRLTDFNQNGLRPFLEPALAEKKLVSIKLNGTAAVQLNPKGDSSVKADLQVTNLVVSDPQQQVPATPLEARVQIDTSLNQNVADVRQLQITLTPTARAKNQVQLQGKLDMSQTNSYQGKFKLASESLDVTTYYDLFTGEKKPAGKQPSPSQTKAAPATSSTPVAEKEPDAKQLPFRDFTAEIDIKRFYLREVEISNLLATAKINGGHIVLNPFKLALNGAPATANVDLDLGVPGYKYDTSFDLQSIPLAPLVNSFAPDRKGQVGGTLSAQAKVSGTGTTGASLQKTLTGQFDMVSTNLNLSVINVKSRMMKALINVVAAVPELLKNPQSAIGTVFESVTGAGGGGLTEELKKSPINSIIAKGTAGSGRVDLAQAVVQSPAFRADSKGTVTLAEVLTNSPIQLPVSISLSHDLGQRVGLVTAETPTNAAYVALPDFYTMKGTVGDPKNDIDKKALFKIAAKGIVSAIPGGKTNELIQGLTGILSGSKPAGTNASPGTGTNAPATNQAPLNNLLNDLLRPKKQ